MSVWVEVIAEDPEDEDTKFTVIYRGWGVDGLPFTVAETEMIHEDLLTEVTSTLSTNALAWGLEDDSAP